MEAVKGSSKTINFVKKTICHTCNGSKLKPGTKAIKCNECDGRGRVVM